MEEVMLGQQTEKAVRPNPATKAVYLHSDFERHVNGKVIDELGNQAVQSFVLVPADKTESGVSEFGFDISFYNAFQQASFIANMGSVDRNHVVCCLNVVLAKVDSEGKLRFITAEFDQQLVVGMFVVLTGDNVVYNDLSEISISDTFQYAAKRAGDDTFKIATTERVRGDFPASGVLSDDVGYLIEREYANQEIEKKYFLPFFNLVPNGVDFDYASPNFINVQWLTSEEILASEKADASAKVLAASMVGEKEVNLTKIGSDTNGLFEKQLELEENQRAQNLAEGAEPNTTVPGTTVTEPVVEENHEDVTGAVTAQPDAGEA